MSNTKLDPFGLEEAINSFSKNAGVYDSEEEAIFEFPPINIVEYVESPKYMDSKYNPSTGLGCYPCVMDDLVAIFGADPYNIVPVKRESFFSEGVGTGKTTKLGWMTGFQARQILGLRNPIKWFNDHGAKLLPNSSIDIAMISRTEANAKDVVFQRLNMSILMSEWFNENYLPDAKVMSKVVFDGMPRNRNLHVPGKIYKNVSIIPASSSEFAVLGKNLQFAIIDEVTKFQAAGDRNLTTEETDQAEVLHAAVKSRVTSRFGDLGHVCCVGNPESSQDFLQRHFREVAKDPKIYTVQRRSVWNAKIPDFDPEKKNKKGEFVYPHFYFDVGKQRIVPTELYDKKKKRNSNLDATILKVPYGPTKGSTQYFEVFRDRPEVALRDYAGIPTDAVGRWWSDSLSIIPLRVNKDRVSPIDENLLTPTPFYDPMNPGIPDYSKIINLTRTDMAWYAIHIDLAEVGDAATLVMSHPCGLTAKKSPLMVLDLIYRYQPSQADPFQVSYIRDLVWWLWKVKKFPMGLVTADQYQSFELLQTFSAWGLNTEKLSVDAKSQELMDNMKWSITESRLDFFQFDQFDHEVFGLEKQGKKVVKNQYGSDDVVQGVAGSIWNSTKLALLDPPVLDSSWDLDNELVPGEGGFSSTAEIF